MAHFSEELPARIALNLVTSANSKGNQINLKDALVGRKSIPWKVFKQVMRAN
jgi:hypothetical protein